MHENIRMAPHTLMRHPSLPTCLHKLMATHAGRQRENDVNCGQPAIDISLKHIWEVNAFKQSVMRPKSWSSLKTHTKILQKIIMYRLSTTHHLHEMHAIPLAFHLMMKLCNRGPSHNMHFLWQNIISELQNCHVLAYWICLLNVCC